MCSFSSLFNIIRLFHCSLLGCFSGPPRCRHISGIWKRIVCVAYDEINIMKKLNSDNIVKILGTTTINSKKAIVMELCACSLHDELNIQRDGLRERKLVYFLNDFLTAAWHISTILV